MSTDTAHAAARTGRPLTSRQRRVVPRELRKAGRLKSHNSYLAADTATNLSAKLTRHQRTRLLFT